MQINLNNVGKRFNLEWIFRNLHHEFIAGNSYAITGSNGAGKSTLLQIIGGALTHSEGSISFLENNTNTIIPTEQVYKEISIVAPYLELIEEMTANEFLAFHKTFKRFHKSIEDMLLIVGLQSAANKQIRYYSSGMKQRLKLAQAFFSSSSILLLDEPTTNLDAKGILLYHQLVEEYTSNKIVIVSSNDEVEYRFCKEIIRLK
jgi:ABC-type multidrug transport system ATPase subunit